MAVGVADKQDEEFDVVDEAGRVVGRRLRREVHAEGLLHRACYAFLFDSQGRVLLQQRSPQKQICPSCWDLSVAEHLEPGESYRHAALRGLREELGVAAREGQLEGPLVPVHLRVHEIPGSFCDRELVTSFLLDKYAGAIKADPAEVAGYRWVALEEAYREAQAQPDTFTPWCLKEFGLVGWFGAADGSSAPAAGRGCAQPQPALA